MDGLADIGIEVACCLVVSLCFFSADHCDFLFRACASVKIPRIFEDISAPRHGRKKPKKSVSYLINLIRKISPNEKKASCLIQGPLIDLTKDSGIPISS